MYEGHLPNEFRKSDTDVSEPSPGPGKIGILGCGSLTHYGKNRKLNKSSLKTSPGSGRCSACSGGTRSPGWLPGSKRWSIFEPAAIRNSFVGGRESRLWQCDLG